MPMSRRAAAIRAATETSTVIAGPAAAPVTSQDAGRAKDRGDRMAR